VGGAGSGKSLNFVIPAVISALFEEATVVLFDYKFENQGLAELLIPVAIDQGYQVRILAPGSILSGTYNVGDSIKDSADLAGAREVVASMVRNNSAPGVTPDGFFDPGGRTILEAAFLFARWVAEVGKDPDLCNILMVAQILGLPNLSKRLKVNRERIPAW
jgi:type IV secretory pathway TraG/TraD family ATPase VirD4